MKPKSQDEAIQIVAEMIAADGDQAIPRAIQRAISARGKGAGEVEAFWLAIHGELVEANGNSEAGETQH